VYGALQLFDDLAETLHRIGLSFARAGDKGRDMGRKGLAFNAGKKRGYRPAA
jgi:hypothetical protein